MSHKTRWQARFEGRDGERLTEVAERRIRNIRRSRVMLTEVRDEDRAIEQRYGLKVH